MFLSFKKDAELASRSSGDDSWGTNPSGRGPIMVIYLIQVLTAGEQQALAMHYPAVRAENNLCLHRGHHMQAAWFLFHWT